MRRGGGLLSVRMSGACNFHLKGEGPIQRTRVEGKLLFMLQRVLANYI